MSIKGVIRLKREESKTQKNSDSVDPSTKREGGQMTQNPTFSHNITPFQEKGGCRRTQNSPFAREKNKNKTTPYRKRGGG